MDLNLKGKRALVTGGSKGIGRACADVLAAEGCEVLIAARNPGSAANARATDLSQRSAAEELAAWAGDLDILVNNAGAIPGGDLLKVGEDTWRRAWDRVIPFFAFPPAVRRVIYTTNAIESINARLRKIIKSRGHFPSDDAATKLIWLALRNITADWGRAAHNWKEAMNQFAILYEERFTQAARTLG